MEGKIAYGKEQNHGESPSKKKNHGERSYQSIPTIKESVNKNNYPRFDLDFSILITCVDVSKILILIG